MILKMAESNLCFIYKSLWSKFSFVSLGVIFSKWMELKRRSLSIRQGSKFSQFEHLCVEHLYREICKIFMSETTKPRAMIFGM